VVQLPHSLVDSREITRGHQHAHLRRYRDHAGEPAILHESHALR
jgi:hypothetical protein